MSGPGINLAGGSFTRIYSPTWDWTSSSIFVDNRNGFMFATLAGQDTSGGVRITPQAGTDSLVNQFYDVTPGNPLVGLVSAPINIKPLPAQANVAGQTVGVLDLYLYRCVPTVPVSRSKMIVSKVAPSSGTQQLTLTAGRRKIQVWFFNESGGNAGVTVIAVQVLQDTNLAQKTVFTATIASGGSAVYEFDPAQGASTPNVSACDVVIVSSSTNNCTYNVVAWD